MTRNLRTEEKLCGDHLGKHDLFEDTPMSTQEKNLCSVFLIGGMSSAASLETETFRRADSVTSVVGVRVAHVM